uniref:Uncharacterized protein n=1 Tax=Avena sativa TaxID=4498 RepID=A0ACD6A2A6_AVESA
MDDSRYPGQEGSGDASVSSNPVTVIKKAKLVPHDGKLSLAADIPVLLSHASLVSESIVQTRDMAKDDHHVFDPVEKPISPYVISVANNPYLEDLSTADGADETIKQTLDMLNADYVNPDPPEEVVVASDTVPTSALGPDGVRGPPSYDEHTPIRGADVEGSGDRTVGPIFDSTPGVQEQDDGFPVWQDTPSQSIDGTEEVTQEHNVKAQLELYVKQHSSRVAAYNEKVKMYYRKHPSKSKQQNAGVLGMQNDPPAEPCAPIESTQKNRVVVAKRLLSAMTPTRRSPRVAVMRNDMISAQQALLVKGSSSKRCRTMDETYVPDVDDDSGGEDAAAACPEKPTKNKRGRVVMDTSPKNVGKKIKVAVMRKPCGIKKAGNDDNARDRFQQTVRCLLGEVLEAMKLLKDAHIKKFIEAGFGCVFDWVLEGNVSRVLMCFLLKKIDTTIMKIDCGAGRILWVNREAVHHIFGFPMGGETIPKPAGSGHDSSMASLKEEIGFESNASIDTKDLHKLLAELVKDESKVDTAVKVFFAIIFTKLVCPGSAIRLGREAAMLVNMDYNKMASSDFCQLVIDELKRAAEKYQDPNIAQAGPEGCDIVPVVMYLDSYHSKKHSMMHLRTPRANFLHEKPLKAIYSEDIIKNGKSDLSNYVFGKLPKGRNDIVYSYSIRIEDMYIDDIQSHEPLVISQHPHEPIERSEHHDEPIERSQHPDEHIESGKSTSSTTIKDIDQLLQKVSDTIKVVPTTVDRLGSIAGLFPIGHGPTEEVMKEASELEVSFLGSMVSAVKLLHKGLTNFGHKQDLICTPYETEADTIARQMDLNDDVPACGGVDKSTFTIVLGQSAVEAQEEARVDEKNDSQDIKEFGGGLDECIFEEPTPRVNRAPVPVSLPQAYHNEDDDGLDNFEEKNDAPLMGFL